MVIFEKIKRKYLSVGLDEPFDVFKVISSVMVNFNLKVEDSKLIQEKTFQSIKYLLDSGDFEIIEYDYKTEEYFPWDISPEESMEKLKIRWNKHGIPYENLFNEDDIMALEIALTKKGERVARAYLDLCIRIEGQVVFEQRVISLSDIMLKVKQGFQTNDIDEIKYETVAAIGDLIAREIIEAGSFDTGQFIPWKFDVVDNPKRVKEELEPIVTISQAEDIAWFRNTPFCDQLIKESQETGIPFWDVYEKERLVRLKLKSEEFWASRQSKNLLQKIMSYFKKTNKR